MSPILKVRMMTYADDFIEDMMFFEPQAVMWAGSSMSRRNDQQQQQGDLVGQNKREERYE